ncbi:Sodium bicarbonate transporter-like protein 11 [Halotydeus destructor]|nr:Sodium bicarbonate transporter-like protein 11 [Halotydeus destructor]
MAQPEKTAEYLELECSEKDGNFKMADLAQGKQDTLVRVSLEVLENRDFRTEIRGDLDVEHCLKEAIVLLDIQGLQLVDIVEQMVQQVVKKGNESDNIVTEVTNCLYADKQKLLFRDTIKSLIVSSDGCSVDFDHSWMVAVTSIASVLKRHIIVARLRSPMNLGSNASCVRFFALVLAPVQVRKTKSAFELSKTLATLLAFPEVRVELGDVASREAFIRVLMVQSEKLNCEPVCNNQQEGHCELKEEPLISFGKGIAENVQRRARFYASDFVDGVRGHRTVQKVTAATFFLYFLCLLPCIAFGVLNSKNTGGKIDTDRALIGQALGGLLWAFLSGQPFVIIATTAPIALCNKIVFDLSDVLDVEFYTMYAWVGIWNSIFLILYGLFGLSNLIQFSTRSVEEIFSMFIVVCFTTDAFKDLIKTYQSHYSSSVCSNLSRKVSFNNESTLDILESHSEQCDRGSFLLFVILMLGTVWLAVRIYQFKDTPYLSASKRILLSDYALPIAVVVFSILGCYLFSDVSVETFPITGSVSFKAADMTAISGPPFMACLGLGFAISLLFFMDQGVSAQLVDTPTNKLKKGSAHHWDFVLVGMVNIVLSLYGLPWMHGLLPHSPLHVQALADTEEVVDNGHVRQVVVRVRETRLTGIMCHVLIGLTVLLVPTTMSYIPVAVLDGLFLYCALASLRGNSFSERISLLFTEQSRYPPTHYVRQCPQATVHWFTATQLVQLVVLVIIGYAPWPYLQMTFPLFIALLIPCRHILIPKLIDMKYLKSIDGYH